MLAVTGFWSSPSWLRMGSKRYKTAAKVFKFDEINKTGKLRVKKTGMYLVYAQVSQCRLYRTANSPFSIYNKSAADDFENIVTNT